MSPTPPLTGPCSSGAGPCPGNGSSSTAPAAASGWPPCSWPGPVASPSSAPPALPKAAAWPTEQGAHHVLDHHREGYLQEALRLTEDRGVDLICELLADVNLDRDLEILATRGRVVVIGSRGTVTIDPRRTMMQESDIRGMTVFGATDQEFKEIHAAVGAGLANGTLKPVVGRELPLAEAAQAHRDIMEKKAYGKIVLIP